MNDNNNDDDNNVFENKSLLTTFYKFKINLSIDQFINQNQLYF